MSSSDLDRNVLPASFDGASGGRAPNSLVESVPRNRFVLHEERPLPDGFEQQVRERLGVLPDFFRTARSAPGLMEELWHARAAYLDRPLPAFSRERVFGHLSQFCAIRYCSLRHVGFLVRRGFPAGAANARPQSVEEAMALLERPALEYEGDLVALLHEHPELARLMLGTSEVQWAHSGDALRRARADLRSTAGALRSSQTRFQALIMATSDMLYMMSPDWAQMRILDGRGLLPDSSTADADWLRFIPPDEHPKVKAAVEQAIATRSNFELEHRVLRADGTELFVLSRAVPIFGEEGAITEWFGAAMDLTARKKADDELRNADRHKDEILATLAHELRNPLALLRNGLYMARRSSPSDAPLVPTFGMMDRQLKMLVHLVDDLLDVARINAGKIQLRSDPVVLQDVLSASLEACRAEVDARAHELRVVLPEELLTVVGDFNRLVQVFSNLLANAAKYTDPRGTIEVRMGRVEDTAVVSVRDTGIGISAADLPGIFDLFSQVHAHEGHANGGLGIGLSLVRRLTGMHGGSVQVASDGAGKGSTFTVRLPLRHAQLASAATATV